ncbi:MAG: NAD+ synthase [Candidatus Omnitrophica bacterium]|nr:NAD+ synthase [Candidatus Omnitrophota bacterium]
MRTTRVRLAQAQINVTVGDIKGNIERILEYVGYAQRAGADMVVFPELAVCGYPPEDLLFREDFLRDSSRAVKEIGARSVGIIVVVGFPERDRKGNIYNAAAVLAKGKTLDVYRKKHLPNYGVFDEKRYFVPGEGTTLYHYGKALIGINICEDIWAPDGPFVEQSNKGGGLIINISASPYHAGKTLERESLIRKKAAKEGVYVSYTNLVGGQDELVFDGGSFVAGPGSRILSYAGAFRERLLVTEIEVPNVPSEKRTNKDKARYVELPFLPRDARSKERPGKVKRLLGPAEIYEALTLGIRDYTRKNGFSQAVLGLSGGIDSSLTAAIAADALGAENVYGVWMPSRYSSEVTEENAVRTAAGLGINFMTLSIEALYGLYLSVLDKYFLGLKMDTTEENLQARIRGTLLMAISNKFGRILLSTSNKSETAVGYCTLYGDMAGGFAPLKDVPKTMVYSLAEYRDTRSGKIFPRGVFKVAPTAELKHGQKDEDTLPAYHILDKMIKEYVECRKTRPGKGEFSETVRKVIAMIDRNEYKRRQGPPGIKITPLAFGRDRRLPITNRYRSL